MIQRPSERNLAIAAYRRTGHTLKQTAEQFGLGVERIRSIEGRVRDYLEAQELLKADPDNIMLLARTGHVVRSTAIGLEQAGILRLPQLKGRTLRDLLKLKNVNGRGALSLLRLAAERGIEVK